ncbi:MAG: hypothetical protein ACKVOM_01595 [Ferruginibacter sp.]
MKKYMILLSTFAVALFMGLSSCKKDTYSFGDIKTPTNFTVTATPQGITTALPNGDGTGKIDIVANATNGLSYTIDYGDGTTATDETLVPTGKITHRYTAGSTGTYDFTITVNAIGTGGATSTLTKTFSVYIVFQLDPVMIQNLTNGSSKIWVTDRGAAGHFGVGAGDSFTPNYYSAMPDSREACAYDDEITISKDNIDNLSINIDNKGQSFIIGAATAGYGLSGGDNCYTIATIGVKPLAFSPATSASTPAVSTRVQFKVPGNGILNFATGGNGTYEILSLTPTTMNVRNIGADGNSWYQKLKPKP